MTVASQVLLVCKVLVEQKGKTVPTESQALLGQLALRVTRALRVHVDPLVTLDRVVLRATRETLALQDCLAPQVTRAQRVSQVILAHPERQESVAQSVPRAIQEQSVPLVAWV